jgi:hypothetical protein
MTIELSDDEALVLFDLLHDYGSIDDAGTLRVRYSAERHALWALSARLEKQLSAPFQPDYDELLSQARARVEQEGGPW